MSETKLAALKKQDIGLRLAYKLHITRKLYSVGFNKKEILALFKFIDWIINYKHKKHHMC